MPVEASPDRKTGIILPFKINDSTTLLCSHFLSFLPSFLSLTSLSPVSSSSPLDSGCKTGDLTASGTRQNLVRPDCKQRPGRAVGGNELLNYLTLVKLDFTARGLAFSILLELGRGGGFCFQRNVACVLFKFFIHRLKFPFFPLSFFLSLLPSRLENKTNFKIPWLVPVC